MKKASRTNRSEGKQIIFSSLFGACAGLCALPLLLMIFSAICLLMPDPHPFIAPISFFAIYKSAFLTGFIGVKRNGGKNALFCGALSGTLITVIFWVVFALLGAVFGIKSNETLSFIWKLLMIPSALLGAFLGLGGRKKKKNPFGKKS